MRQPQKLMMELTGKETYIAVYRCFLARMEGKEPPFTDTDLQRAIDALEKRHAEYVAYYNWCKASYVVDRMQSELRVAALRCCWRLTIEVVLYSKFSKTLKEHSVKRLQAIRRIECTLHNIALMRQVMEAFGEVLELDMMLLVRGELRQLEQCLEYYEFMAEGYEEMLFLHKSKAKPLPPLSLNPASVPADFKQQVIDAIHRHKNSDLMDVMDVMLTHYREAVAVQPA